LNLIYAPLKYMYIEHRSGKYYPKKMYVITWNLDKDAWRWGWTFAFDNK